MEYIVLRSNKTHNEYCNDSEYNVQIYVVSELPHNNNVVIIEESLRNRMSRKVTLGDNIISGQHYISISPFYRNIKITIWSKKTVQRDPTLEKFTNSR